MTKEEVATITMESGIWDGKLKKASSKKKGISWSKSGPWLFEP